MALSTENIGGSGKTPKTINPGVNTVKLNSVDLVQYPFMQKEEAYFVVFNVETKPMGEGFEGFFLDKDDESKGRHEGQVGQVKENKWNYKDSVLPSGDEINRDKSLLGVIKRVCLATDCIKWFEDANGKYETIEEFYEAFNKDKPYAGVWLEMVVAGKDYQKKNSEYTGTDMFLPKTKRGVVAYRAEGANNTLLEYDEASYWEKIVKEDVSNFSNNDSDVDAEDPFAVDNAMDEEDPFV